MNNLNIVGTMVKKAELERKGECSYTRFTIAVNDFVKGENKTMFFNCVAFGKTAENICKYLDKGYTMPINGTLKADTYKNKAGKSITSTYILVNSFDFVTNKKECHASETTTENDFLAFNCERI